MSQPETLPGAERFYQFLCSRYPGKTIAISGPTVVDRSYGMDFTKIYQLIVDHEVVGTYSTFGPRPGETDFCREFKGRIPGYLNKCARTYNQYAAVNARMPEDHVSLIWSNSRFINAHFLEGDLGTMERTPWQRQDGHEGLPDFP